MRKERGHYSSWSPIHHSFIHTLIPQTVITHLLFASNKGLEFKDEWDLSSQNGRGLRIEEVVEEELKKRLGQIGKGPHVKLRS